MDNTLYNRVFTSIDNGRLGLNKGIPINFPKLRRFIPNIQKKTYYLIGAATKCGKTSLADDIFLYGVWDYVCSGLDPDIIVDIDYYSFEISPEMKIIKGIARQLWKDYGLIVDVNTILSKGENYCSDEIYQLVKQSAKYFENIESILTLHSVDNPTGISKYLWDKAEKHGEIVKKNIEVDSEKPPIWRFDHYKPYNTNRHWIIIIDHVGLTLEESHKSLKDTMDLLSKRMVAVRNNFGATIVVIQQLSFDTTSTDRFKLNRLAPMLSDFSDSRYLSRDAEIIITLFNPSEQHLEKYNGYNINNLGNSFRALEILVNREGPPNINLGLNFIGPVGTFRELPVAIEMTDAHYHYSTNYINEKPKYKLQNGIYVEK